jgi:hypothetical protein
VQEVRQEVAFWHLTAPVHADVVPLLQVPFPSHMPAVVSCPLEHAAEPHVVPEAACWHVPPAAHLPVLPHVLPAVHWPAGALVPATMLAHVPSAWPVSAIVHALQVPLHAELQQIWLPEGPMQLPFRHCASAVQVCPSGLSWHVVPVQRPLWQSPATAQVLFVPQSLF